MTFSFRTPNTQQSFFQNYQDHLKQIESKANEFNGHYWYTKKSQRERWNLSREESQKHLKLFQPLRDGYDFLDDVLGATIFPIVNMGTVVFLTLGSLFEACHTLAIKIGISKEDGEEHGRDAVSFLLGAAALLVFSVAKMIQSVINLLTRPFITAVKGFNTEEDEDRFYDEERSDWGLTPSSP